jgi:hypothetical protein
MISETLINAAANTTLAISALGLLVHIFGDPDNSIWDNKVKAYLAKIGLSITICGAIANVITLSTPNISEVVVNCGMSVTFFWLSWWQYELFKEAQAARSRRAAQEAKKRVQPCKNHKLDKARRRKPTKANLCL